MIVLGVFSLFVLLFLLFFPVQKIDRRRLFEITDAVSPQTAYDLSEGARLFRRLDGLGRTAAG